MTDIYAGAGVRSKPPKQVDPADGRPDPRDRERLIATVELLFFAYRDFTGEADAVLTELGFGRAHHRVLHFVNRRPGLRVADLLDILKITKQSLARVLKQLVDEGYILQQAGSEDRRQRLLYLTGKGTELADKLAALQIARVADALARAGPEAGPVTRRFLASMIAEAERPRIEKLIFGPDDPA
ncbi:MAG: MarR family transcriptional regulator [Hyphomicrobiaceae bacterium]|nr:MarR family transcriptional regulator [Hyphomicrobiaceae bacterium]